MTASPGTWLLRRGLVFGGVLALLLVSAPLVIARSSDDRTGTDFRWSGKVARGKTVEIRGVNGGIHAEATTGAEVVVTAIKRGHRDDPDEVRIEVSQHEDGITVCTIYPGNDGDCRPGGRSENHNNDVTVEYTVQVPAGVNLDAHTVNGSVRATELDGRVSAATVNGNIDISTKQIGEAATVNGSIVARLGLASWDRDLSFETVNGSIELNLPPSVNADVRAETMNGSISTDFPLNAKSGFLHHRVSGTLGKGGRELRLRSLNGGIELRNASGRSSARGT